jgi:hypothetical protein
MIRGDLGTDSYEAADREDWALQNAVYASETVDVDREIQRWFCDHEIPVLERSDT